VFEEKAQIIGIQQNTIVVCYDAIHSFKYPTKSLKISQPSEFSNITATSKSNIRLIIKYT